MRTRTRPLVVRGLLALSVFATLALPADAAQEEPAPEQEATPEAENVLLVILDDVGRERIGAFSSGPAAAPTPTIDALARRGVCFDAAWATPYCSPTRATILTGRHASRTGVGHTVSPHGPARGLSPDEWTLPKAARDLMGVRSAMVGKWHLAGSPDGRDHARKCGFDRFLGTLANLGKSHEIDAYSTAWTVVDNEVTRPRGYITTVTVDDALESIAWFGEVPWVVVVSFHAAHFPLHAPPADLHSQELSGQPMQSPMAHHIAMVESVDRELGRLLASIGEPVLERTHVIVVGDNGTQGKAMGDAHRPGKGKGTMHETGVGVPLVIAGPGVASPGTRCAVPVHTTDLFPTALALMGAEDPVAAARERDVVVDGRDLSPLIADPTASLDRDGVVTEWFRPNHAPPGERTVHRIAVRSGADKLVMDAAGGGESLYDLGADDDESADRLRADDEAAGAARDRLRRILEALGL